MFLRFDPDWPPIDPSRREPARKAPPVLLDARQQKRLMQAIGLNVLLLFVAPIGGATVIGGLIAWWG
jgi:hypothetical protein